MVVSTISNVCLIQPLTMGLEIGRLMEISTVFDIFAHNAFLLSKAEMHLAGGQLKSFVSEINTSVRAP